METYADWLRERSDDELRALVSARPELISPVPADIGGLAARAAASAAVSRALDRLDRFTLALLEALLVLPQPVPFRTLRAALGTPQPRVRQALAVLRERGLVWGADTALRTAPGLRQAFPTPAGLGPPAAEAFAGYSAERLGELLSDVSVPAPAGFADPGRLVELLAARLAEPDDLVEQAGPDARAALDLLTWGPPVGRVEGARRPIRVGNARSPLEALLARGLLAAADDRTVTLPREVALHLRGGAYFRDLTPDPPSLDRTGPVRSRLLVDQTAGGQAFTIVRQVEELLEWWGVTPPPALRSGGLGVRDLRAAATRLDVPEPTAALVAELAYSAGLLARGGPDGEWLPTRDYDVWRMHDTAARWAELAHAWLISDRVPSLAGGRDERDRLINALADESVRASAADVRRAVLAALASTEAAPSVDAVRRRLAWQEPRRGVRLRDQLVGWTLAEAELIGLTGLGALAATGQALATGGDAAAAVAPLLPEPVDHVLLQADLTAVAPGPLESALARELALMADVESTGGATVYRFTPESVRRALDAGRAAAELADLLARHSATPVPQPLSYLIDDVARKHGQLRVGSALSYVRCDDPVLIDQIMADRRAHTLRLHRLAPTVVASKLTRPELLDTLRSLGFAPVAESPEGGIMLTRDDAQRADQPPDLVEPATVLRQAADPAVVAAAVRALRAGDEAARIRETAPPGTPPRTSVNAMVDQLHRAVAAGGRVWIGYSDQQGQTSSRIIEPIRIEGGYLTAYDATRATIQRFALHRITGLAPIEASG